MKAYTEKGLGFFPQLLMILMIIIFSSNSTKAADWRFPVSLTYVNNFENVVDFHENNLETYYEDYYYDYDVESTYWPIGLSFNPYVQFDSGLGLGGSIGPIAFIYGDVDFFDLPIGIDLRYNFLPKAATSPYVRAGLRYHIVSGDYVEGSKLGFLGGIGIEFKRNDPVGFGVEIAYDATEIELEELHEWGPRTIKEIKPYGFMLSIFIVF